MKWCGSVWHGRMVGARSKAGSIWGRCLFFFCFHAAGEGLPESLSLRERMEGVVEAAVSPSCKVRGSFFYECLIFILFLCMKSIIISH